MLVEQVLADLVRTPSVNPGTSELAVAQRVAYWLADTSAEVHFVETFPGRPSVAAVLRGQGDGPRLVLNGHMDTVAVDDLARWSADPFGGEIRDGWMYGRGACDMKAGLAAQIATLHALDGAELNGDLILHFAVGEECGEPGTLSLCNAGFAGDVGIVTEPTELQVSVATRGLVMVRIRILGRSIHASRAHLGSNPVAHLARVLDALERYAHGLLGREHPLLGAGSCTPTVVRAGVQENAVADFCDLHLDRRLIPGETVEGELAAIAAVLEAVKADHSDFAYELTSAPYPFQPAQVPAKSTLAAQLQRVAGEVLDAPPSIVGTPYSSDVRNLINDAGMEAVTFGPGNVAECHCVDERVPLSQLRDATQVLIRIATELLT
jgi:succinyl-diaminopimelate desuccinylase